MFEEQIGKNLALGVGEGFAVSMEDVSKQMQNAIPSNFDIKSNLSMAYDSSFRQPQAKSSNFEHSGITVNIENFVNNRAQDVQAFAQELEFYSRRSSFVIG